MYPGDTINIIIKEFRIPLTKEIKPPNFLPFNPIIALIIEIIKLAKKATINKLGFKYKNVLINHIPPTKVKTIPVFFGFIKCSLSLSEIVFTSNYTILKKYLKFCRKVWKNENTIIENYMSKKHKSLIRK